MMSRTLVTRIAITVCCLVAALDANAACTSSSLNGDYWFMATGTVQRTSPQNGVRLDPVAEIGRVSYDGKGTATLIETVALHGGQSEITASGKYTVSTDCRAAVEWSVSGTYLQTYAIIILQGGAEIETVSFRNAASGGSRPLSMFSQKKTLGIPC